LGRFNGPWIENGTGGSGRVTGVLGLDLKAVGGITLLAGALAIQAELALGVRVMIFGADVNQGAKTEGSAAVVLDPIAVPRARFEWFPDPWFGVSVGVGPEISPFGIGGQVVFSLMAHTHAYDGLHPMPPYP
jgi:hypothetical protein